MATHADKGGCSRNSRGEYVSPEGYALHQRVQQMFQYDVELSDRLYIIDAQVATSADMKALKQELMVARRNVLDVSVRFEKYSLFCLVFLLGSVCLSRSLIRLKYILKMLFSMYKLQH